MYLLPEPQEIKYLEEEFILLYDTIIIIEDKQYGSLYESALLLKEEISVSLGFQCRITAGKLRKDGGIYMAVDHTYAEESYNLSVTKEGIQIIGDPKGILYGVQTLRQILMQEGAILPGVKIKDYPALKNRGFYHDVTRGRVPTLTFLKTLVDKLSLYKINQLQLYIEHSYLFKDFSEVWRDDTPLTAEEILELDRYCIKRNVELIPSVSCFGHLYKVLRTKTYSHLCELPDPDKEPFSFPGRMAHHVLDISNEESFTFVTQMIEEFMPLFSSSYFNIGADETFDLGKGKSKALADTIGIETLYIGFVKRICDYVVSKDKIPMFWGDIIVSFPDAINQLPKETICLNWGYSPKQNDDGVRKLAAAGAKQYLCPGVGGWNEWINQMENAYHNISAMCTYAHTYRAIGVLNTDWGDYGHINHPEFSIPGMIYGAVMSWNNNPITFDLLNKAITVIEYKDKSESFMHIISQIAKQSIFKWYDAVRYKEMNEKNETPDAIANLLTKTDFKQIPQANKQILEKDKELYQLLKHMDSSTKQVAGAYHIAARGIYLFNVIGEMISHHTPDTPTVQYHDVTPKQLAAGLEYWYQDYKELWRSVSKESELSNISDVIFWYADYLRNL